MPKLETTIPGGRVGTESAVTMPSPPFVRLPKFVMRQWHHHLIAVTGARLSPANSAQGEIPIDPRLCWTLLNTAAAPDHNLGTSANTGQGGHWGQPWGTLSAGQTIRLLSFQIYVDIFFIHPLVTYSIIVALAIAIPGLARCAVSVSPISQCARRPPPVFTILLQGLSRSTAGAVTSTPTGDPASCARYAQQVFCQRLSYTFGKMDLFTHYVHNTTPQNRQWWGLCRYLVLATLDTMNEDVTAEGRRRIYSSRAEPSKAG